MTRPFDPRLLTQVPSTRWPLLALGSIGVGQGLAAIALTFAVTTVVVAVVEGRPVLTAFLWLVGLFVVRAVLAASSELVASWAGVRVSTILRERLVGAWLTRDGDSRPEAGRAQALANQGMTSVEPYVARYLPALVSGAFVPLLAIGTLAFVDWPSALIVVLTVPLLPVFAALIGHTTQESTQRRWRSLSALSGHFLDVMRGLPTLASYGRAQVQVESIATVSQGHRIATMKTLRLAFMSSAALELLATISVALVAVAVGLRLAYGTVPLDTAMLAILLAPEAYWPIRRIGTEFHAAADGAVALADALAEIDRPVTGHNPTGSDPAERKPTGRHPTGRHPTGRTLAESDHAGHDPAGRNAAHPDLAHPNTTGHNADERATPAPDQHTWPATVPVEPCSVVMDGVGYSFPGATASVLENVSFTLTTGLTVVTGPSGAGKSTLLELMAGLRRPSTGDLTAPRAHLVSQRPFLAPGTIRDNLTLGNDSTDDELREILRVIGLDDLILALAQGLDTRLGDDGFGLSAGQRSRLTLARAALSNAPLILLDEPTAHLDDESATLAHDLIQNLALVRTVVAVTHRQQLQSIAHQHVRLDLRPAPDLAGSLP